MKTVNTFKQAIIGICRELITSGLLDDRQRDRFQQAIDKQEVDDRIYAELHGADTYIYFSAEDGQRWDSNNLSIDEYGDEYSLAFFKFEVNYPSHRCTAKGFTTRVEFFTKVANLVKTIEDNFSGKYYKLDRTAEEIEQHNRDRIAAQAARLVADNKKNLRVGQSRTVEANLPQSSHEVNDDTRKFTVVIENNQAVITRKS